MSAAGAKETRAVQAAIAIKNIHQKMLAVMAEVTYLQKDADKKVNGQYSFISHDQVTRAVRPHLVAQGIIMIPRVIRYTQDGNRMVMETETDFINAEQPEDRITVPMVSYANGNDDKLPGKALSYAVKMTMLKAFCIETGDEADIERQHIDHHPGLISDEQLADLEALAEEVGAHVPSFCKFLKVNSLADLPVAQYKRAVAALESKRKISANKKKDNANG